MKDIIETYLMKVILEKYLMKVIIETYLKKVFLETYLMKVIIETYLMNVIIETRRVHQHCYSIINRQNNLCLVKRNIARGLGESTPFSTNAIFYRIRSNIHRKSYWSVHLFCVSWHHFICHM